VTSEDLEKVKKINFSKLIMGDLVKPIISSVSMNNDYYANLQKNVAKMGHRNIELDSFRNIGDVDFLADKDFVTKGSAGFKGLKPRSKSAGRSSSNSGALDDDEEDEITYDGIMRYGKKHQIDIDQVDVHILANLGPNFDPMYNKLTYREKKNLYQRLNPDNMPYQTMVSDYELIKANKSNPKDVIGREFQQEGKTVQVCTLNLMKCIEENNVGPALLICKDLFTWGTSISTKGSIMRVAARNNHLGKILNYDPDKQLLTPAMVKDIKAMEDSYKKLVPGFKGTSAFGDYNNNSFARTRYNQREKYRKMNAP
jgi:hypothetical protein